MHPSRLACLTLSLTLTLSALPATADDARGPPDISLEDLLGVELTGASRKAEQLHEVAATVLVISREDFERSGATSIPQALRLAPGVEVASLAKNRFGNKLLVPMDGRSIYSPLFSGVLREYEDTLLEDIDRIEAIRGPSAAMWGANAVIGVINIITRRARDTQGKLLVAGAGSEERLFGPLRHGGQTSDGHFRVWSKSFKRDEAVDTYGHSGNDYSRAARVGFRQDWRPAANHRRKLSGAKPTRYRPATRGHSSTPLRNQDSPSASVARTARAAISSDVANGPSPMVPTPPCRRTSSTKASTCKGRSPDSAPPPTWTSSTRGSWPNATT